MGVSITGASGTTYTDTDAQAFRRANGDLATFEKGKSDGLSNAQMASLLGLQASDVDAYEEALIQAKNQETTGASPPASSTPPQPPRNVSVTTPAGYVVTRDEAQAYRATFGDNAAFARGKALGMTNADMAKLLGMDQSQVDAFESNLRQSADKPSDNVYTPDLTHPATETQWWVQKLWLQPKNPDISDADIVLQTQKILADLEQTKVLFPGADALATKLADQKLIEEMVTHEIPVQQFVDAMRGVPGFSREAVEKYLTSLGLPPSPEAWRAVVDESVTTNTRLELDKKGLTGLDGSGVKVRVLEPLAGTHADMVSAVINHRDVGLAPGAKVEQRFLDTTTSEDSPIKVQGDMGSAIRQYLAYETGNLALPPGEPGPQLDEATLLKTAFAKAVSDVTAEAAFGGVTEQIKDFTHSDAQVLNMSFGATFENILVPAMNVANQIISSSPELQRAIIPDPSRMNAQQYNQAIADFVADAVFKGSASTTAHQAYVDATREAAQANKVIVVAAANGQTNVAAIEAAGIRVPDLAAFNGLAMSDAVIAVGASETNGTPRDVRDDTVANFSSHGGTGYGVTVTTQGTNVAVPFEQFIERGHGVSGTSFAAPAVAATVALLLQQNPNATFADVKNWLVSHAVNTAASTEAEGAGMLDLPGVAANV